MTTIKSLVGVAVLYKCNFKESITLVSLNKSLDRVNRRLTLLVYDNGPEKQFIQGSFEYGNLDIRYKHDPKNPGISRAYNEGVKYASKLEADWILLLDQDTYVNSDFCESFLEKTAVNIEPDIVCIIPRILSANDNTLLSPSKMYPGGITRPANKVKPGILEQTITSINSGTFISSQFIRSVGGFSDEYPLDMLDHWYFREIKRKRKKVLLLNTFVNHNLSVYSFSNEVSAIRYDSILLSERKFFRSSILNSYIYKFRLVFRLIKQFRAGQKEHVKLTIKYLFK